MWTVHDELTTEILDLGQFVRYVAYGEGQRISTRERDDLEAASEPESDRFEELLVNPTLVTLTRQRGELDCGGLRFVIVGYGNFNQLVTPSRAGHVSVALEKDADALAVAREVAGLLERFDQSER
jgi:hypothetical protein